MASGSERIGPYLFRHKGYNFALGETTPEYIDSLQDFEIRDSDVFLVTYPKSGTVWTQQILCRLFEDECPEPYPTNLDRMPWLEYREGRPDYNLRPSPRLFASHLTPALLPRGLREKRAKVVYVMRNPKDAMVSYFYFSHVWAKLETPKSFEDFMEKYLNGDVGGSSWFGHVREWHASRGQFDILFLAYEDMVQDLKSAVRKIGAFLGRSLDDAAVDRVAEKAAFKTMRDDPRANYEFLPADLLLREKGGFLRKGTVGDWKNVFTVAQSERFDQVFQERMSDLPLKFTWEIKEQPVRN
ncbi:amine sulfotransferase-like [Lepisosteus oculatus]|uniref:amine sulfotransferase-like n=1 Tax=Lepisosteus oculatus TaxID=7918 RepID=UPI0035F51E1A